jgi:hypothetical protein
LRSRYRNLNYLLSFSDTLPKNSSSIQVVFALVLGFLLLLKFV